MAKALEKGSCLRKVARSGKNLKTGAGSGSSLWQWLVLPTTFSAYLPFCSFCKLKHQCCAQALQKGSTWPCERAPALICSHAGKMEKKEVAAWKQQQYERSRRDVSIGDLFAGALCQWHVSILVAHGYL